MLAAMGTTLTYRQLHQHQQQVRCFVLVIATLLSAATDITAFEMTTVGPALSSDGNLTLVLLTPFDGDLGFERNAAASTQALQQAQADGLLPGMTITYVQPAVT